MAYFVVPIHSEFHLETDALFRFFIIVHQQNIFSHCQHYLQVSLLNFDHLFKVHLTSSLSPFNRGPYKSAPSREFAKFQNQIQLN